MAVAGDRQDIVLRLVGQAAAVEPFLHPLLAGIIGGSGEAKIAKALAQFGEIGGGRGKRLLRIEGVIEAAEGGSTGHELGQALRALGADGTRIEQTFLPDQPGHEGLGQAMLSGAG